MRRTSSRTTSWCLFVCLLCLSLPFRLLLLPAGALAPGAGRPACPEAGRPERHAVGAAHCRWPLLVGHCGLHARPAERGGGGGLHSGNTCAKLATLKIQALATPFALDPQPTPACVHAAIGRDAPALRSAGCRSSTWAPSVPGPTLASSTMTPTRQGSPAGLVLFSIFCERWSIVLPLRIPGQSRPGTTALLCLGNWPPAVRPQLKHGMQDLLKK